MDNRKGDFMIVNGTSNGILFSNSIVRTRNGSTFDNVVEDLDGSPLVAVDMSDGCSIYKRGEIDDAAMWS
jgi:hypothetical protein